MLARHTITKFGKFLVAPTCIQTNFTVYRHQNCKPKELEGSSYLGSVNNFHMS